MPSKAMASAMTVKAVRAAARLLAQEATASASASPLDRGVPTVAVKPLVALRGSAGAGVPQECLCDDWYAQQGQLGQWLPVLLGRG